MRIGGVARGAPSAGWSSQHCERARPPRLVASATRRNPHRAASAGQWRRHAGSDGTAWAATILSQSRVSSGVSHPQDRDAWTGYGRGGPLYNGLGWLFSACAGTSLVAEQGTGSMMRSSRSRSPPGTWRSSHGGVRHTCPDVADVTTHARPSPTHRSPSASHASPRPRRRRHAGAAAGSSTSGSTVHTLPPPPSAQSSSAAHGRNGRRDPAPGGPPHPTPADVQSSLTVPGARHVRPAPAALATHAPGPAADPMHWLSSVHAPPAATAAAQVPPLHARPTSQRPSVGPHGSPTIRSVVRAHTPAAVQRAANASQLSFGRSHRSPRPRGTKHRQSRSLGRSGT